VAVVGVLLQGGGVFALLLGGLFVLRGLASGALRPAEIVARLPYYRDVVVQGLLVSLAAVAAVALLVVLGAFTVRYGRDWMASWWRYRRRWASVMAAHELTGVERKRVLIPQLRAIAAEAGTDVLTVVLLPGQSRAEWDARSDELAAAFGAYAGRVRSGADPATDIDLVLLRGRRGGKALAGAFGPVLGLPRSAERQLVATVRAWSCQFSWTHVRVRGHDERYRSWFAGRVRWDVMNARRFIVVRGV
jgi:hypothetical protein